MKWVRVLLGACAAQAVLILGAGAQSTPTLAADETHVQHVAQERALAVRRLIPHPGNPPENASEGHPDAIATRTSEMGEIYISRTGETLYMMYLNRYRLAPGSSNLANYCTGPCADQWRALPAPPQAQSVGAWRAIEGPQGWQWAYGRYPVFTFVGDRTPSDINGHEYSDTFFAINVVPPAPSLRAPPSVTALLVDYQYVLADRDGKLLYAYANEADCPDACQNLTPLIAGMANRDVGDWRVAQHNGRPQWTYGGKLVFVSRDNDTSNVIDEEALLRP